MKNRRTRTPNRLLTDTLREIKNTRSRFISIMILSALAVCFLAGLRVTEPDMKNSVDQYLDAQRLMDLRVASTLGLTEEDVAVLGRQEGVELAQGAYTIDATVKVEDRDSSVKAISFTEDINIPDLLEGRLPEKAGECLVEPRFLQETGLSVGDTIILDTGTGDYEDALVQDEFTIVGSANSPLYIGVERGCPKNFKKSYKFFCRGLDIRVPQIVEPNFPQAMCFEELSKALGNCIGQDEIAHLIHKQVPFVFFVITVSAEPLVVFLLLLQLLQPLGKACHQWQSPQAGLGLGPVSLYQNVLAFNVRTGDNVTDGQRSSFKADGVPPQAQYFAAAQSIKCRKLDDQFQTTASGHLK